MKCESVRIESRFEIQPSTMDAYRRLDSHHYKGSRPGAPKTVYAMFDREQVDVVERFRSMHGMSESDATSEPPSPPVGVLVLSLPRLSCRPRDLATRGRYTRMAPRRRAILLNREVRVISRVVIDPRYRGLGLAVQLVRHALDHAHTVYTEALAAMGRINPFFEKAGMAKYEQPTRADHARLLDALHELDIEPWRLASPATLMARIETRGPETRAWFDAEMRRWVGSAFRIPKHKREHMPLPKAIDLAREHVLSTCVYYLHRLEKDFETNDAISDD